MAKGWRDSRFFPWGKSVDCDCCDSDEHADRPDKPVRKEPVPNGVINSVGGPGGSEGFSETVRRHQREFALGRQSATQLQSLANQVNQASQSLPPSLPPSLGPPQAPGHPTVGGGAPQQGQVWASNPPPVTWSPGEGTMQEEILELQTQLHLEREKLEAAIKLLSELTTTGDRIELESVNAVREQLTEILDEVVVAAAEKKIALDRERDRLIEEGRWQKMHRVVGDPGIGGNWTGESAFNIGTFQY